MKSHGTKRFQTCFAALPSDVQSRANNALRLWEANQRHPGLRFKKVHTKKPVYSIRIGRGWRALGVLESDQMVWFWIGSHADYDRLVSKGPNR